MNALDKIVLFVRGYDPDRDAVQPGSGRNKTVRSARPSDRLRATDTDTEHGRHRLVCRTEDGAEWKRALRTLQPKGGRNPELTEADLEEMDAAREKLFEEKARELKLYWAACYSYTEAVREIDRPGFSRSAIAPYFAAFSRAHVRASKSVQLD